MNIGKRYSLKEFVIWSRRDIYKCFFLSLIPTLLYSSGWKFLAISWMPVAMLGTAVAFIVGFKNNASYIFSNCSCNRILIHFMNSRERLSELRISRIHEIFRQLLPTCLIIGWAFLTLDAVGDSSINPFEGSANDVPITQISKMVETDLREMLNETELPEAVLPVNNILM